MGRGNRAEFVAMLMPELAMRVALKANAPKAWPPVHLKRLVLSLSLALERAQQNRLKAWASERAQQNRADENDRRENRKYVQSQS
jgi:hypothetical protein